MLSRLIASISSSEGSVDLTLRRCLTCLRGLAPAATELVVEPGVSITIESSLLRPRFAGDVGAAATAAVAASGPPAAVAAIVCLGPNTSVPIEAGLPRVGRAAGLEVTLGEGEGEGMGIGGGGMEGTVSGGILLS